MNASPLHNRIIVRRLEEGEPSSRRSLDRTVHLLVPNGHCSYMFRLIVSVRRGTASNLPGAWERHPTIEQARAAAAALLHNERVTRIAVVRDEVPPAFVEWLER